MQCRRIQVAAAAGIALDEQQRGHVEGCRVCAAVLQELGQLEEDLADLRQRVPEELLEAALQRVAEDAWETDAAESPSAPWFPPRLRDRVVVAGVVTGLAVLLLSVFVGQVLVRSPLDLYGGKETATVARAPDTSAVDSNRGWQQPVARLEAELDGTEHFVDGVATLRDRQAGASFANERSKYAADDGYDVDRKEGKGKKLVHDIPADSRNGSRVDSRYAFGDRATATEEAAPAASGLASPGTPTPKALSLLRQAQPGGETGEALRRRSRAGEDARRRENQSLSATERSGGRLFSGKSAPGAPSKPGSRISVLAKDDLQAAEAPVSDESAEIAYGQVADTREKREDFHRSVGFAEPDADQESRRKLVDLGAEAVVKNSELAARTTTDATGNIGGLAERGRMEGAAERPVYFENTYLGGNAKLALLDRLAGSFELDTRAVVPHRLARLPLQRFDPPAAGGVALYVDLDRATAAHGQRTRVFLQVGLKGGENPAWRRPPLSLAVLPFASSTDARGRALAAAAELRKGLDEQDAFTVVQPGRPIVFTSPGEADSGDELAATGTGLPEGDWTGLLDQVRSAFQAVEGRGGLRNRRLVIVTDGEVGERARTAVHRLGLQDVATSVIALDSSWFASHARVALAGLGNLHVARSIDEARRVARDELTSFTRVVARAVRLNVQPAPGARLIQVLGSRPLGRTEKRRVKAAELAIDRHVERTTGIASDRGDDDPGLQAVIPYFYGGDEHVVMVEFEVDGPGPVADVSIKYKDLVDMRNQTLRASGVLSRPPAAASARHEQVRRNLFSFAVARVLRGLERGIRGGRIEAAAFRDLEALIAAARGVARAGGEAAAGISNDVRMLEQYLQLAGSGSRTGDLAKSLEYARLAKLGRSP
jgi:hypothetical protein